MSDRDKIKQILKQASSEIENVNPKSHILGIMHSVRGAYASGRESDLFDEIIPFTKRELISLKSAMNNYN